MKVALAQINPTVGDLEGNVERCLAAIEAARRDGADLVVLPEMAVPGYPPRDILFDPSFRRGGGRGDRRPGRARQGRAAGRGRHACMPSGRPAARTPGPVQRRGAAGWRGGAAGRRQAAAAHLRRLLRAALVPAGPGAAAGRRSPGGGWAFWCARTCGTRATRSTRPPSCWPPGPSLLVCLSASPYRRGILAQRLHHARRPRCPLVAVNLCGANDELIFDGRSFALDGEGRYPRPAGRLSRRRSAWSTSTRRRPSSRRRPIQRRSFSRRWCWACATFADKNRLARAFLGLSGGIDSAVVAVLAAEALGPERVTALAIPSRYTDPRSTTSAQELAGALGIGFEVVELEPLHAAAEATLGDLLDGGTAAENVQARLRAMILMAFVNRHGGLLLNTSNKTELALGYATLYGDMAGGLGPIADLTKPEVVALARWIDAHRCPIPRFILERPPSAELKPDQVDPFDYPTVAPAMEHWCRRIAATRPCAARSTSAGRWAWCSR